LVEKNIYFRTLIAGVLVWIHVYLSYTAGKLSYELKPLAVA